MVKLKNLKMSVKFIAAFLIVGIIPFSVMGLLSMDKSGKALSHQAFNQLEALQTVKKIQIEDYFKGLFLQMDIFAQTQDVHSFYERLIRYHNDTNVTATGNYDVTTSEYQEIWNSFGKKLRHYQKQSGMYDVFLICAKHGHVMYTNAKESDLGENLGHGQYKETGLATLWKKIVKTDKQAVVDMAPYAPSNDEPAMFAGYPIHDESGSLIGIIAFQIPLNQINKVMASRHGMGETGETYLVGSDQLMRSDSFLDPKNHTVKASFANPNLGKVDTKAVRKALAGNHDQEIIKGYNGNPVLSSYAPFKIMDLTWAVIAEIDAAEAFAPVKKLQILMGIIALIGIITITGAALAFTRSVTKPILQGVEFAKALSEGDLTQTLDIDQSDEIGILAKAMNQMSLNLNQMFTELTQGVEILSSSSTELSAVSSQMSTTSDETSGKSDSVAAAAEEMSSSMNSVAAASEQASTNVQMVAAAAEEMSSTITEIARSTERGRSVTKDAVLKSGKASEKVDQLGIAARQIGSVTETIAEISEQTNLLALNATIEAARAGEAGKGFAVVAGEIKDLAKQTAAATQKIRESIEGIQNTTDSTVKEIEEITTVISNVNEIVTSIATAVEEQSAATQEIADNVNQAALGIQDVNQNVAESSSVSEGIAREIVEVSQASKEMSDASSQVNTSAEEMSTLAEQIHSMTSRFTIN